MQFSLFSLVSQDSKRFHGLWRKIIEQVHEFNIFSSLPLSEDPRVLKNQKISTWLFILLLTISIAVLLFYSIFIPVQKTVTVKQPTYDQYLTLYSKYLNNLQCPCKTVSVTYERFLQLNYTLHHICSSFLVSEQWIQYVSRSIYFGISNGNNFGVIGRQAFQALRSFCQLTDEIIQMSLSGFYETQYVSAYLTASDLFRRQNEAEVEHFILSVTQTFVFSLKLILNATQSNSLFAGVPTNYGIRTSTIPGFVTTYSKSYSNCSCKTSASCHEELHISDMFGTKALFIVPGFYSACYIIESLLVSSFQCFYDEQCFDNVTYYIKSTVQINATVVDPSLSKKFTVNSTVGDMIDALMVEQWNSSIAFANYYAECEPTECTYTIESKNDAIYIVTIVFGLVGGLVKILKLIVPRMISLFMSFIVKKNGRIGSATNAASNTPMPNIEIT